MAKGVCFRCSKLPAGEKCFGCRPVEASASEYDESLESGEYDTRQHREHVNELWRENVRAEAENIDWDLIRSYS